MFIDQALHPKNLLLHGTEVDSTAHEVGISQTLNRCSMPKKAKSRQLLNQAASKVSGSLD